MLKKLLLPAIFALNINCMSKLFVMKCSQKQYLKLAKGIGTQVFGSDVRNLLINTISNISASASKKEYIVTFDLTEEINHENKSVKEIVKFMAEEEIDERAW